VSDYLSSPLDLSQPLGFLAKDQPDCSTSQGMSSDDAAPGPSRTPRGIYRSSTPHRTVGSISPRRSKSPSPRRSKSPSPTRPVSSNPRPPSSNSNSRPTSSKPPSRPTSGRSSSVDRPKSRTASGASSSFSQPSSDFEDDGLFIRGKSAGSRSDRVGTGRRVRFGGESELKTPSPSVLFEDHEKENINPGRGRKINEADNLKPSHIPVRIKTENGPQVSKQSL